MINKCSILTIDSTGFVTEKIKNFFTDNNFDILKAKDIQKAWRLYRKNNPHLIIVEIRNNIIEPAIRFMRRVRSLEKNTNLFVYSKNVTVESVIEAIRAGASDYVFDPISDDHFKRKIISALEKKNVQSENVLLKELANLHEITLLFSSTQKMDDLLPIMLNTFIEVTKADSGSIYLLSESEKKIKIVASKGIRKKRLKSKENNESITDWVCKHETGLLVSDGKTIPKTNLKLERANDNSSLCLPLRTQKKLIGVVNLNRRASSSAYTINDLYISEVLAGQTSVALENAQTYNTLKKRVENLEEIRMFGESLMQLTEKNKIIDFILSSLIKVFGAEVSCLIIPVKRRFEFHITSTKKLAENYTEKIIDLISENISEKVKILRKKVKTIHRIGNTTKEHFLSQRIVKHNSYKICPLWNHEKWIGAIYVGSSRKNAFDENILNQLASVAHQTCISIMNARLYEEIKENHLRTIKALAIAVDAKDTYTRGHSENVMKYSVAVTEEMGILDPKINEDIQNAALLHDIGKIGIPGHILNKPGKLTKDEFTQVMKNHVQMGANIIQEVPFLKDLVPLILHHHERYDGKGYPDGLKGDDIPIGARILTVADSFEAMTSNRPYRKSLPREVAISELVKNKGTQFDPNIVDIFLQMLEKKFPLSK